VGPRAGLDTGARGKILCPCRGSNPDRPVVQPVVRHYTAWANPAPGTFNNEDNYGVMRVASQMECLSLQDKRIACQEYWRGVPAASPLSECSFMFIIPCRLSTVGMLLKTQCFVGYGKRKMELMRSEKVNVNTRGKHPCPQRNSNPRY
jgi:hypothetical protein